MEASSCPFPLSCFFFSTLCAPSLEIESLEQAIFILTYKFLCLSNVLFLLSNFLEETAIKLNCIFIVYREKVIHLLAVRPYKKIELISRLTKGKV